jgi:uncharacterized ferritin-like protein (DUF455 family)
MIKKKKQASPESKHLLNELEEVVQRLGYKIRYEKGDFEGGYCLLKELKLFVINTRNDIEKRIAIIAGNLKSLGIDDIYVKPHIRELVEKEIPSEETAKTTDDPRRDGSSATGGETED